MGVEASFIITTRDAFRNKITTGGAHITIILHLEGHDEVDLFRDDIIKSNSI